MNGVTLYHAADFSREILLSLKGDRSIFVVFSSLGDREAHLIHDKLSLLRTEIADCIDGIFLAHRRAGAAEDETERLARQAWPGVEILVCNDYAVPDMGDEPGKGADMRRVLHYINRTAASGARARDAVLVYLDADVLPAYFGAHYVMGLAGAVLSGHDFARASFFRRTGRLKKFVAQPLYSVILHPDLERLADLHYPLAGEAAGTLQFFNGASYCQRYGVETVLNIDCCVEGARMADVNLGLYDHEHHGDAYIQKMSFGIIRAYLTRLVEHGVITLAPGARIADVFRATYIDEHGVRQRTECDLAERTYAPLEELL